MVIGSAVYPPIAVAGATDVKITSFNIVNADTEYSHTLEDGLVQLRIKCKGSSTLRIAFEMNGTSADYWTINKGCSDSIDGLSFSGKILYLRTDKPNMIVEVMELYT